MSLSGTTTVIAIISATGDGSTRHYYVPRALTNTLVLSGSAIISRIARLMGRGVQVGALASTSIQVNSLTATRV